MNKFKKYDKTKEILKEIDYKLAEKNFNKRNDIEKTQGLYIVKYKSKPIRGVILELTTINPELLNNG